MTLWSPPEYAPMWPLMALQWPQCPLGFFQSISQGRLLHGVWLFCSPQGPYWQSQDALNGCISWLALLAPLLLPLCGHQPPKQIRECRRQEPLSLYSLQSHCPQPGNDSDQKPPQPSTWTACFDSITGTWLSFKKQKCGCLPYMDTYENFKSYPTSIQGCFSTVQ